MNAEDITEVVTILTEMDEEEYRDCKSTYLDKSKSPRVKQFYEELFTEVDERRQRTLEAVGGAAV